MKRTTVRKIADTVEHFVKGYSYIAPECLLERVEYLYNRCKAIQLADGEPLASPFQPLCPTCDGAGVLDEDRGVMGAYCLACGGSGRVLLLPKPGIPQQGP